MCIYAKDVVLDRVQQAGLLCVGSLTECAGSPRTPLLVDAASRTPIDEAIPTY